DRFRKSSCGESVASSVPGGHGAKSRTRDPTEERDVFAKSNIIAMAAVGAAMLAGATVAQADGGRPDHHLFPRALGPAAGEHLLSGGHGLREDFADQAVVADRSGEVSRASA